jgi:hypothetical protein
MPRDLTVLDLGVAKVTGAKPPLRPKHVWSIRTKAESTKALARGAQVWDDLTRTLAFDPQRSDNLNSTLRSHEAMGMLRTQEVMMQVSYPLSAGNRHI